MPAFTGVGPAQSDFQNSSLLSADSYALLRSITGGYVVFKDSSFIKGGILDFFYKMGNVKDTTTRDIWHYEKGSIIPIGVCASAVTDNGGGSYTFTVTTSGNASPAFPAGVIQTNGAFPYNPDGVQVNQTPPSSLVSPGPTFSFGVPGEVVIARNGSLRAVITSKTSTTITVQTGSANATSWSALTTGDRINILTAVTGERDPFHPGYSQTNSRFGTTIQNLQVSSPELTLAQLSQQRSYAINGQNFVGPEYLEDMNTMYAMKEAYAMLLGIGQQYTYTDTGNAEVREEILGIIPAAETLGFDNGTITINANSLQAIADYNFANEGGNNLACFAGRAAQFAISSFFRTASNGFTNGGITFDSDLATGLKKINFDYDGWKIGATNFMVGSGVELDNPRVTGGYTNATAKTTKYTNKMILFPMGNDLATITNPTLTSGSQTQSTPFGFSTYYITPRDFKGPVGSGRMYRFSQTPEMLGTKTYLETMGATIIQQYVAGVKLQTANV